MSVITVHKMYGAFYTISRSGTGLLSDSERPPAAFIMVFDRLMGPAGPGRPTQSDGSSLYMGRTTTNMRYTGSPERWDARRSPIAPVVRLIHVVGQGTWGIRIAGMGEPNRQNTGDRTRERRHLGRRIFRWVLAEARGSSIVQASMPGFLAALFDSTNQRQANASPPRGQAAGTLQTPISMDCRVAARQMRRVTLQERSTSQNQAVPQLFPTAHSRDPLPKVGKQRLSLQSPVKVPHVRQNAVSAGEGPESSV